MKQTITYYSKKGCPPCEMYYKILERKFKPEKYKKITLQTNEETLATVTKYNTRHVPFIVINENTVIHSRDLQDLLFAIKST
jgi:glutaredoxin